MELSAYSKVGHRKAGGQCQGLVSQKKAVCWLEDDVESLKPG